MPKETPFRTERELVESFVDFFRKTTHKKSVHLIRELQTPNGVPDLVIYTKTPTKTALTKIAALPERFAFLAAEGELPPTFGIEQLKEITGLSNSGTQQLLRSFERIRLVKKVRRGHWESLQHLAPPIGQICAIEAKKKEWRKAIYQASRYQDFANQSWVLLDEAKVTPALKEIAMFKKLNVGLATINKNNVVAIYFLPKTESPRFNTRYWAVNVAIAKRRI